MVNDFKLVFYRILSPGSEWLLHHSWFDRSAMADLLDVRIPATDGSELRMRRHTKPEKVHPFLLDQLGFTLPAQPPPEIHGKAVVVETF